jgi:beta-glucanase (GH16 family)
MAVFVTGSYKWGGSSTSSIYGTSGSDNLVGTSANESFYTNGGWDTLTGGAGDDRYYIGSGSRVVEQAGGGVDMVIATTSFVLPDNVENLEIWGAYAGVGNGLDNIVKGNAQNNTLNGAGGNDLLTGAGGTDTFAFEPGSGYDVVTDFMAGSGSGYDIARLGGYTQFKSFADVQSAMEQVGSDVILTLSPTDGIKFQNTSLANFTAANFQLPFDPSGLKLTFGEEFDTLSLWNPTTKTGTWRTDYGYGSTTDSLGSRTLWTNNEQQIYTDPWFKGTSSTSLGLNPFTLADGVVTITAAPAPADLKQYMYNYNFTSGLLTTKPSFAQTYGYFEARIDLPEGAGAWPAFWLLPADGSWPPELDVMEAYGSALTYQTVHSKATGTHTMEYTTNYVPGGTDGFHTYGVLWTKESITWYIDGVAVDTAATPADMNKPMYMLLNLAVQDKASPTFTADMKIDYVRAYSLDAAPVTEPTPTPTPTPSAGQVFIGTSGDDSYTVTSSADMVQEAANGGTDTVTASVDYTLPNNVENLILAGSALNGTGNALDNILTGNDLANILNGGAGNDTLYGMGGSDTLVGGLGNDTFYVTDPGDTVVENAGEGYDVIRASVDYTLSANVEDLVLIGNALKGVGNAGNNWVIGNDLNNVLQGGAGDDNLSGWGGNDTLSGGKGNDKLTGGAGADVFQLEKGFGKDVITDFQLGIDKLDVSGIGGKMKIGSSGGSVMLSWGQDSVTLVGISPNDPLLKTVWA